MSNLIPSQVKYFWVSEEKLHRSNRFLTRFLSKRDSLSMTKLAFFLVYTATPLSSSLVCILTICLWQNRYVGVFGAIMSILGAGSLFNVHMLL
jgi:hypothetical protein